MATVKITGARSLLDSRHDDAERWFRIRRNAADSSTTLEKLTHARHSIASLSGLFRSFLFVIRDDLKMNSLRLGGLKIVRLLIFTEINRETINFLHFSVLLIQIFLVFPDERKIPLFSLQEFSNFELPTNELIFEDTLRHVAVAGQIHYPNEDRSFFFLAS